MEIEKIWKNFNISFILILPLFNNILNNVRTKDGYRLSVHSLFYQYGLRNCYLLDHKGEYNGCLRLLFDKKSILNSTLYNVINKPIYNLLDLLTSYEYFQDLKVLDDSIIIYLRIDDKWDKDIDKIMDSKYSLVSEKYKDTILYKGDYHLTDNAVINYLYLKNIPAKILVKHDSLQKNIEHIFNYNTELYGKLDEVFPKFDNFKESLNLSSL